MEKFVSEKNQLPKLKPKARHLFKVHIWGALSKNCALKLAIFTGIMKKESYVNTILKDFLLPYLSTAFSTGVKGFNKTMTQNTKASWHFQMKAVFGWKGMEKFVSEKNQLPKLKPKARPLFKVHIWGALSKNCALKLAIFTGIMKKESYVNTILKDFLLPYLSTAFSTGVKGFNKTMTQNTKASWHLMFSKPMA